MVFLGSTASQVIAANDKPARATEFPPTCLIIFEPIWIAKLSQKCLFAKRLDFNFSTLIVLLTKGICSTRVFKPSAYISMTTGQMGSPISKASLLLILTGGGFARFSYNLSMTLSLAPSSRSIVQGFSELKIDPPLLTFSIKKSRLSIGISSDISFDMKLSISDITFITYRFR